MDTHTRRAWLAGMAAPGLAAALPQAASAKVCSVPVDRRSFERYAKLFCDHDPAFMQYYTADVVLDIGSRGQIKTPQAIYDYYGKMRENFVETMDVLFFCSDAGGVAVELSGSYRCIKDAANSAIFNRSLHEGEVRRHRGIVLYTLEGGKFKLIRGPKAEVTSDWRMES